MDNPQDAAASTNTDPLVWLDRHGDALYRYALLRVRDQAVAEELVQDTFVAALAARSQFGGQASERTWLIAILKNKIIDHLRRAQREEPLPDDVDSQQMLDALFDHRGHWSLRPLDWGHPDEVLENQQFWRVFEDCLAGVPARSAEAFFLREVDGLTAEEVCKVLDVTPSNLWVSLHRARMRLRLCLEIQWFNRKPE
jgi:RNA polymerase sigma-70 factor (ECF subfamily)